MTPPREAGLSAHPGRQPGARWIARLRGGAPSHPRRHRVSLPGCSAVSPAHGRTPLLPVRSRATQATLIPTCARLAPVRAWQRDLDSAAQAHRLAIGTRRARRVSAKAAATLHAERLFVGHVEGSAKLAPSLRRSAPGAQRPDQRIAAQPGWSVRLPVLPTVRAPLACPKRVVPPSSTPGRAYAVGGGGLTPIRERPPPAAESIPSARLAWLLADRRTAADAEPVRADQRHPQERRLATRNLLPSGSAKSHSRPARPSSSIGMPNSVDTASMSST